jgi:Zn-dependent protease with chaperone function
MNAALYLVRGASLALAWLLAVNALGSLAVAFAARRAAADGRRRAPAFWLALRLTPSAASTVFALFIFAPSYWRYEPRNLGEAFDLTIALLAAGGVAVIGAAAARGIGAWRGAVRRADAWTRMAYPLALDHAALPAFTVDTPAPMMALAGILRPRLLVARGVLQVLTDEELRAAVAHELGHRRAWDNLKRLAMRAAPDLLRISGAAAALESRWASAAEHAADRRACGDARTRCALASALVKIARLTPAPTPLAEPISTLVDGGEIASRVQHLLSDAPPAAHPARRWPLGAAAASVVAVTYYVPVLHLVHEATELLVHTLP